MDGWCTVKISKGTPKTTRKEVTDMLCEKYVHLNKDNALVHSKSSSSFIRLNKNNEQAGHKG